MEKHNTLLYYCYSTIANAEQFAADHLKFCKSLGLTGRIIVAEEGLNGTVSGTADACKTYMDTVHADPRFAAVVAEVPYAVDFDPASLAHPRVPLGLVRAGRDIWLPAPYHLDPVRRACQTCVMLVDLPNAGHGSLLSPQPVNLKPPLDTLMRDPPGFDRALVAPAHAAIVGFMRQHLLP